MSLESLKLKIPFFTPKSNDDHEANMRAIDRWQQDLIDALLLKIRPAGLILPWAGDSSPDDDLFVFPYGQTLTNADTSYPRLWTNISSTFKSGTSIILPDLRGRCPVFLDNMGGSDAGRLSLANTIGTAGGAETVAGGSHAHDLGAGFAEITLATDDQILTNSESTAQWTADRSYNATGDNVATGLSDNRTAGAALGGSTDSASPAASSVLQPLLLLNALITL